MKKIFITGGLGYLGTQLAKQALKKGYHVCLYDSLIYEQEYAKILDEVTSEKSKSAKCDFIIGDTRNTTLLEKSLKDFKPDFLFHFAELGSVWAANHNPAYAHDINFEASKKVLDLCEKLKIPVIYNSTSNLYGNQVEIKILDESAPIPTPTDYYCKYKLEMEKYIESKVKKNPAFKIIVLRPAIVCGPSPRMRLELLPNHFTYCAVAKGLLRISELNAYRPAIDIDDIVEAYFAIMNTKKWPRLIYNIGHHNLSKMQFGTAIQSVVKCKIGPIGDLGNLRNLQIDSTAFFKDFKFKPEYSIEDTIKKMEKWLEVNLVAVEKSNYAGVINMALDQWLKII
jgi:nucleoside-diphosphate-sugar epimerase